MAIGAGGWLLIIQLSYLTGKQGYDNIAKMEEKLFMS